MQEDYLFKAIQGLTTLLYPVMKGFLLYAAVLFFRADRRSHTWCLVVGAGLNFFLNLWRLALMSPLAGQGGLEVFQRFLVIQSGLGLIGTGLVTYGLVAVALIQFRRSRMLKLAEGNSPS